MKLFGRKIGLQVVLSGNGLTIMKKSGGVDNPMFTPQNKPVEAVIKSYYKSKK